MPAIITRRIEFDAGHRVLRHESKCANLHGHRYVAELSVSANQLDAIGRVVDFGVIKELVGGWVDQHWDHNLLLNSDDPLYAFWRVYRAGANFGPKTPFPFYNANPTAEVMSRHLFHVACELLRDHGLLVEAVRLYETPNCWADYTVECHRAEFPFQEE